jgi:hypothetical protein
MMGIKYSFAADWSLPADCRRSSKAGFELLKPLHVVSDHSISAPEQLSSLV